MTNEAYISDVMALARVLYDTPEWRNTAWSVEGRELEVELAVPGESFAAAIAAQSLLLLTFDAAQLASAWADEEADPFDFATAQRFVDHHRGDVIFVDLALGSFLGRFALNPSTPEGQSRILAIFAGVAHLLSVLSAANPDMGLPLAIVSAGLGIPAVIVPFLTPKDRPMPPLTPTTIDISALPPGTQITIVLPDDRD